jgi:MFS family permease
MITITFGGWLSDRFGRRPVLFAGCLGFLVLSWPAVQQPMPQPGTYHHQERTAG